MRTMKTRATCLLVAVCSGEATQATTRGKPPRASIDKGEKGSTVKETLPPGLQL